MTPGLAASYWDLLLWPHRLEGDVESVALRWHPIFGAGMTAGLAAGLFLLVLWSYRRGSTEQPTRRRVVLVGLPLCAA